jgi:hypothetical protein
MLPVGVRVFHQEAFNGLRAILQQAVAPLFELVKGVVAPALRILHSRQARGYGLYVDVAHQLANVLAVTAASAVGANTAQFIEGFEQSRIIHSQALQLVWRELRQCFTQRLALGHLALQCGFTGGVEFSISIRHGNQA